MNGMADPSPRVLQAVAVALIIVAAFSYGFVPERADNDVWWHLKTGQRIVETGRLPMHDPFTFTGEDMVWHNHEWLAQVLFYKIFAWGGGILNNLIGLRALIGFKSCVLVATFLLVLTLVQQRCRCLPLSALITLLALDVSRYTLYPRPPVSTYLLMAGFLLVLSGWKSKRWPSWALLVLPVLTALWANLHGGFLVGLFLIGFYLVGEVIEHFFWRSSEGDGTSTGEQAARSSSLRRSQLQRRVAWLGGTLVGGLLATLCTPYGIHLYELFFRVMGASALVKTIAEMGSPLNPNVAQHYLTFFVMAGLVVAGLGAARRFCPARPPAADLLVLLFFGYEAAAHIRHLPLFAIATAPILGGSADQLLDRAGERVRRWIAWAATGGAVLIAACWIGLRDYPETYWNRNVQLGSGIPYVEINYPKDVCDFIVANQFDGGMLNPVNCSGYLIFRLSPEIHKVFTDSRFDIFGDRFVWYEWAVSHGIERDDWDKIPWKRLGLSKREGEHIRDRCQGEGWPEILDRWKINFVITEYPWAVRNKMRASSQWESVFYWTKPYERESGYEIFVRRIPENLELISRCRWSFEQFKKRL